MFIHTLVLALAFTPQQPMNPPQAPVAEKINHTFTHHGVERIDEYYWMRERENPKVVEYLEAENDYIQGVMKHTKDLQEKLFEEIKGRIKQTDMSVPYVRNGYIYFTRTEDGKSYSTYCRRVNEDGSDEEVLLDVNQLAEGKDFCSVSAMAVSPDNKLLAYAADFRGRRIYTIYFKDLETGKLLDDTIEDVTGNVVWANDSRTIFYTQQDLTTLRPYLVKRHQLGQDSEEDATILQENDDQFRCYVYKSRSKDFIFIGLSQTLSDEFHVIDANKPMGKFKMLIPRERNHECGVNHYHDQFFIRTNRDARNFKLVSTTEPSDESTWKDVIPHRDNVLLESYTMFKDYMVVEERKDGLMQIRVRPWEGDGEHYLNFGEPAYLAFGSTNAEADSDVFRYGYTSLTTPRSIYDYDMKTRKRTLLKQTEVLGDFDSSNYKTERLLATAHDGVKIPISLVYRKDLFKPGTNPLLLYGYGSYGSSMDAAFRSSRLSLIDRGFVFAIAHIRGGEEMGRQWYDDGKLLKKKNTFSDFISAGEFLSESNYADPKRMFAQGGSAGGLLIGAVINARPDLFHGAIAGVPFVDVVTTMLDDSIPLTTNEYDEWGNPNEAPYFHYMLSYSPYDNVSKQDYPHLLVTAGFHDSQVQYWEPAKWVARLRDRRDGNSRLLLKTEMSAGHGGPSGRYNAYKDTAFEYAFLIDLAE